MRIDFVIGGLRAGGAERVVSVLANYFAAKNHVVRVITFNDPDDYELHPAISRIKFHKKGLIRYSILRGFFSFLFLYYEKGNRPDVICSHIDLMGYATIIPSRLYGIKLTVSEHFNHHNQKITLAKRFLWNCLYRYPDAVTVLTKFDLPFFQNKSKNVVVMPNPCSFKPIDDLHIEREKVILAVGDLNRYNHKGFDNLIDIMTSIFKNNSEWHLKIVGDGTEGKKILENQIKKNGIEDRVTFTGFRKDVHELMKKSEIFILTSRHEGLPMVLIEAMSQGMVCISYDCISGPSEIITNDIDGILVKDQDKNDMIIKLGDLVNNHQLRERIRSNTPQSLEKFSLETVGNKWETLFNSFLINNKSK